jgi:hypothetical protein
MRRLVATLILVASLGACGPSTSPSSTASGPPAGGLTQGQAFEAAMSASPDATGVVSGRVGQIRDFDTGQQLIPGDQWVWAIVVSGTFAFSCGPAPEPGQTTAPCPSPGKTRTVILDYTTGRFLEAFGQSGS